MLAAPLSAKEILNHLKARRRGPMRVVFYDTDETCRVDFDLKTARKSIGALPPSAPVLISRDDGLWWIVGINYGSAAVRFYADRPFGPELQVHDAVNCQKTKGSLAEKKSRQGRPVYT